MIARSVHYASPSIHDRVRSRVFYDDMLDPNEATGQMWAQDPAGDVIERILPRARSERPPMPRATR